MYVFWDGVGSCRVIVWVLCMKWAVAVIILFASLRIEENMTEAATRKGTREKKPSRFHHYEVLPLPPRTRTSQVQWCTRMAISGCPPLPPKTDYRMPKS